MTNDYSCSEQEHSLCVFTRTTQQGAMAKIIIHGGERAPKTRVGVLVGGGAAALFLLAEFASAAFCPRAAAVEGGWEPGLRGSFRPP